MKGDLDSKLLTVDYDAATDEVLGGKEILMLINSKKLQYDHDSYPDVTIKPYTSMQWLPLSTEAPM